MVDRDDRADGAARFAGGVPDVYERLLVPLVFAEPAAHLAATVAAAGPADVLETAAGTGVVTRALRERLPDARIVATDLSEAMLDVARRRPGAAAVEWRRADALALPFDDDSFDAVVCQFGVMFFPDRVAGYAEAARVLRPGGLLALTVWDSLAANPVVEAVAEAVARAARTDPPDFLSRTPYAHSDRDRLHDEVTAAGLSVELEVLAGTNRGTAEDVATAFCRGTPLRAELEAHPTLGLDEATEAAAALLRERWGSGVIGAPSSWIEVVALA